MALRSPALYMGNPAVNHTAQNDRLLLAGLLRPEPGQAAANRPLTALSGVLAGQPGTMGEITLLSNTQFTVNPARWVLESTDTPLGGTYLVTNDAVETVAITAQDATQWRLAYFGVWVIDSFVAGSGDDLPHWGLVNGPLAASNPQLPAAGTLPENFLALGYFTIPPTGQAVTYTAYYKRTTLRGGLLHMPTEAAANGLVGAAALTPGSAFYAEDTKAIGYYDAAANRIVWFDTQPQAYTPGMLVGATVPTLTGSIVNARYTRQGRQVRIEGYFYLGAGTSFNGSSGIIYFDYPPGLRPSFANYGTNPNTQSAWGGPGRFNGTVFSGGWCLNKYDPNPALRRMWFVNFSDLVVQGGAGGGVNITAVGHWMHWQNTYDTAFEA